MSKTIQQSLVVLFVLLIFVAGVAVWGLLQKAGLEKQNQYLQNQISDAERDIQLKTKKIASLEDQAKDLRADIDSQKRQKKVVEEKYDDTLQKSRDLSNQISSLEREKNSWGDRLERLRDERDELMTKLKNRPVKEVVKEVIVEKPMMSTERQMVQQSTGGTTFVVQNNADEEYWASVLKEKQGLELKIAELKQQTSAAELEVENIKKINGDFHLEIGRLQNERDEIVRKIKYGEDLADSLAIELARSRNEQKVVRDRANKVASENQTLRSQLKEVTGTKVSLEKSIARLTDEKSLIERKLIETENIIQSRIDEIWKIKQDVDQRFNVRSSLAGEVDLAPIVVNATVAPAVRTVSTAARSGGSVVSINEANNFVIINLGEKDGIRVGDTFQVYRSGKIIGSVAVIQVRKDISAADIKQKTDAFQPGDAVR